MKYRGVRRGWRARPDKGYIELCDSIGTLAGWHGTRNKKEF